MLDRLGFRFVVGFRQDIRVIARNGEPGTAAEWKLGTSEGRSLVQVGDTAEATRSSPRRPERRYELRFESGTLPHGKRDTPLDPNPNPQLTEA